MTKFGKTIFGKILKGAAIAGGSILGLGAGVGLVGGIVKGTGALAGIGKGVGSIKTITDKVGQSAIRVVTGTTKEERAQVKTVKNEARAALDKVEQMQRLIRAGAEPDEARTMAGVPAEQLTSFQGEPVVQSAGLSFSNPVVKWGAIAAGGFILAKMLKIIK